MIEVEFQKVKKIIVYELTEYSFQEFIDNAAAMSTYWQDGFLYIAVPVNNKLYDKALVVEATILMRYFIYTRYPKYSANFKNQHSQEIPILLDRSPIHAAIIKTIKNLSK